MKMKDKKSLKKILVNVLFYVVTIFLSVYIVLSVIAPERVFDTFHFKISTVVSNSMQGTINKGDLIIVYKTTEDKVNEDDIIVFNNYLETTSGSYAQAEIIHRYIDTNPDGSYVTLGDNNNGEIDVYRDSNGNITTLTYDDVVGKYAFRIPFLGWVPIFLQSGRFDPMMIGLIVVNIVIVVTIIKVLKKDPEDKKEEDETNDVG